MKTYKVKGRKGYDDLQGIHPWVATYQGDHSWSDQVDEDHSILMLSHSWSGIDVTSQKAIDEEIVKRKKENAEYIEKCKADGTYGEEYFNTISMKYNKMFDNPDTVKDMPKESFRAVILDFGEQGSSNISEIFEKGIINPLK